MAKLNELIKIESLKQAADILIRTLNLLGFAFKEDKYSCYHLEIPSNDGTEAFYIAYLRNREVVNRFLENSTDEFWQGSNYFCRGVWELDHMALRYVKKIEGISGKKLDLSYA